MIDTDKVIRIINRVGNGFTIDNDQARELVVEIERLRKEIELAHEQLNFAGAPRQDNDGVVLPVNERVEWLRD